MKKCLCARKAQRTIVGNELMKMMMMAAAVAVANTHIYTQSEWVGSEKREEKTKMIKMLPFSPISLD